ncbi:MAG: hypothetical protein AB8B51_15840 [Sedimentitalea sp.]
MRFGSVFERSGRDRRANRAARERALALSPRRLLLRILLLPLAVAGLSLSIYTRLYPENVTEVARGILAASSCEAAERFEQDAVCIEPAGEARRLLARPAAQDAPAARIVGGAKFVSAPEN